MVKESGKRQLKSQEDLPMNIKENMIMIRSVATESLSGQAGILTKDNIKMMRETAMVKCNGQTAASTLESGIKVFSMATAR